MTKALTATRCERSCTWSIRFKTPVRTVRALAIDPPKRLVFTWEGSGDVSFELEPKGDEVLLTVIHRRLPDRATLLGVGTEITFGGGEGDPGSGSGASLVQALRQSTQESTNQAGQRLVEKNLDIQPTITVRPGWPLRVIVEKDLVLRPYRR